MADLKEISEKIKNELTIEQVQEFVYAFGGDSYIHNNIIISRTICHGGDSHKLYYYDNTKLFKCYTQCAGDSFDIFELVIKLKRNDGIDITLPQAINFIIKYFNITIEEDNEINNQEELQDWKIFKQYEKHQEEEKEEKIIEYKHLDKNILKYLPHPHILPWEQEGILREVMEYCGVCYDPVQQGIVIPHYDIDGNLIGIRERTLIKENEANGKYKPAIINYKMYNHSLGFNLYNLNNSKINIADMEKAIIFEGEKSCLLYQSYFGIENDISVAVCGSNLINYQVQLLLSLGVKEICVAFDKQFQNIGDEEWKNWTKKLKEINKKYSSLVKISFIFDKWNMLEYKMSPIDNGKDIFLELFKSRVSL